MNPPAALLPEQRARVKIDQALVASGWIVQDRERMNLAAGKGVAIREFPLASGHGTADYLLFVSGKAVGVLEAKPEGFSLTGVEGQAKKYAMGLPATLKTRVRPLPFMYISTGTDTRFTNLLDPKHRSRRIFQMHRPETLADWLDAETLDQWVKTLHGEGCGFYTAAGNAHPSSLRGRISALPPIDVAAATGKRFGNQVEAAAEALAMAAVDPLATSWELREKLQTLRKSYDQIIDHLSRDQLLVDKTGFATDDKDHAQALVASFEQFLTENKEQIDALAFFYSVPHRERLRFKDIKALAAAIKAPPRSWTPELLWQAYERLAKDKVKKASGQRLLTDIVSLVRFALHQQSELRPFTDDVRERFDHWMAQQANAGRAFTAAQVRWLEMMRDHIGTSLEVDLDDFDYTPFVEAGGLGTATQVFGKDLRVILKELNEVLAA